MTAYSDLQTDVITFAFRTGDPTFTAAVPGFIRLAEAHLNRELQLINSEVTTVLTGTIGSRLLPLPADFVEPVSLHLTSGEDYHELRPDVAGEMYLRTEQGWPDAWAVTGTDLQLDAPCDQAHTFSFRYRAKFALSDAQPTNWLLENHPDVYLAATLGWGAAFVLDDPSLARWKTLAQEALDSVGWQVSRSRLTTMTVDPALMAGGRFNIRTG